MKLPKLDLIPGTDQDFLVVCIIGLAVVYVGTGNWSRERWKEAAAAGGPAVAALVYGRYKGKEEGKEEGWEEGWDKGYNTLNPALHPPTEVQETAAAEEAPPVIPACEPPQELPPGWYIDPRGRYRDSTGRVASEARLIHTLKNSSI